jgi:hypothetical protein
MKYIQKLYVIERKLRDKDLANDEFLSLRKEETKPIFKEFKKWLDVQSLTATGRLGEAVTYTLNQWSKLIFPS